MATVEQAKRDITYNISLSETEAKTLARILIENVDWSGDPDGDFANQLHDKLEAAGVEED